MAITLTVDDGVREALRHAFPGYNTERALNKYVAELERLLFMSLQHGQTQEHRLLKLYSLSTHVLAQKGGCIGKNKIRLHKWLVDNQQSLIEVVTKGSNVSGKLSQCKLTSRVVMENRLSLPLGDMDSMNDTDIDLLLAGTSEEQGKLVSLLYPDIDELLDRQAFVDRYDVVDVDCESLKNYIIWLSTTAKHYSAEKKATALRQARLILAVAQQLDGKYLQRKKPSPFGRTYYEGVSVQSVNKELRRAMLGQGWEYDIRSSVISWKMGFAASYLASVNPTADLRKTFAMTLCYLEDKQDFIATVRHYTFTADSHCEPDFQKKLIKTALTAMSFGARVSTHGWLDDSGQRHNPALVEIFKNPEERSRFVNCPEIRGFIHEQKLLDDFIYQEAKEHTPEIFQLDYLQSHSGRPSKAKVLAFLYQHAETAVMAIVKRCAQANQRTVLAHIHDAIVVKQRLGPDLKYEIELQMQEQTGNPYWRLAAEEFKRFESTHRDAQLEEHAHRERIQQEEARAQQWSLSRSSLDAAA